MTIKHRYAQKCINMHSQKVLSSADPGAGQPSDLRVVHPVRHGAGRPPPRQGRVHIDGGAARLTEGRGSIMRVRRNVGRTPSLRSVGGLRPIRARTRSLRACFRWSGPHTATDSGAVSAGSNPAGGTSHMHKFERSDDLDAGLANRLFGGVGVTQAGEVLGVVEETVDEVEGVLSCRLRGVQADLQVRGCSRLLPGWRRLRSTRSSVPVLLVRCSGIRVLHLGRRR